LVVRGVSDEVARRDFVFTNPVRLLTAANPDFSVGTVVEGEAAAVVEHERSGS
jgi:hypothetical protein